VSYVLATDFPKARKTHICDLCGTRIPAGIHYVWEHTRDGGDCWDIKLHVGCGRFRQIVARFYRDELGEEGPPIWDMIRAFRLRRSEWDDKMRAPGAQPYRSELAAILRGIRKAQRKEKT